MNLTLKNYKSNIYFPVYNSEKEQEQKVIIDIVENLDRLNTKPIPSQEGEFAINCPFCKSKGYIKPKPNKLYINVDTKKKGYIVYNCFRCGTHGVIPINKTKSKQYKANISDIPNLYPFDTLIQKNNANSKSIGKPLTKQAKEYLYNRHVPRNYYLKQNWLEGKTKYRGHLIIPIYELGQEVAFITRDYTEKATIKSFLPFSNKTRLLYNIDSAKHYSDLIIVEGVFDSLFYPNSVALLGKRLYDPQAYKIYKHTRAKDIIICLDSPQKDNNIHKAILQVTRTLQEYTTATIYVCTLPYGDPADYAQKDFYDIIVKYSKRVV